MNLDNKIGWCDATWNAYHGCKNNKSSCWKFCYARRLAENRLKGSAGYEHGFEPTFHPERLIEPYQRKLPTRIFVSSMGELFGRWMLPGNGDFGLDCITRILKVVDDNPQHTFQFLTKFPQNLRALVNFQRKNMWIGTTVTCPADVWRIDHLRRNATGVKFVSFEPLREEIRNPDLSGMDWVIIGAQTGSHVVVPCSGWVSHLTWWAKESDIPVFQKDNLLKRCLPSHLTLLQEFPK